MYEITVFFINHGHYISLDRLHIAIQLRNVSLHLCVTLLRLPFMHHIPSLSSSKLTSGDCCPIVLGYNARTVLDISVEF